jgi:hypothetical protein
MARLDDVAELVEMTDLIIIVSVACVVIMLVASR